MANPNSPYGFRAHRHGGGGVERLGNYRIASGYASAIYVGDMVKLASDGTIAVAAAGDRLLGAFQGCYLATSAGAPTFSKTWPAATVTLNAADARAVVTDDPKQWYHVRSAGTPAVTSIGTLADLVYGTPNAATGMSGSNLSGTMTTGAAQFRILDFIDAPDNLVGIYAQLIVQIFEHELEEHSQATPGV